MQDKIKQVKGQRCDAASIFKKRPSIIFDYIIYTVIVKT